MGFVWACRWSEDGSQGRTSCSVSVLMRCTSTPPRIRDTTYHWPNRDGASCRAFLWVCVRSREPCFTDGRISAGQGLRAAWPRVLVSFPCHDTLIAEDQHMAPRWYCLAVGGVLALAACGDSRGSRPVPGPATEYV